MPAPPIYLDNAATTPVRPEVFEVMRPFFGARFGNPSSMHRWGRDARVALDEARERVAATLGAAPDEICLTSCGTESDNMALIGVWRTRRAAGRNAISTTRIEHKAILGAAQQVAREGGEARFAETNGAGTVCADSLAENVRSGCAVCSVMWVNNETGVMQDVPALAQACRESGTVFHTDAVQAFGKVAIDARSQPFDLLSLSGHKIGAPKGVGALYVRRGTPMEPLLHGGSQDRGRRPGTENVAYAVGLATAAELAVAEREHKCRELERMRDAMQRAITSRIPDAVVHSRDARRAPHILNVSVPGTDSESMLIALDLRGVAASGGSACQSGSVLPSHVLLAMGVEPALARAAVRMSLGSANTDEEVTRAAELFVTLACRARAAAPAV